jgi:adenylosuccinate lyase
MSRIPNILAERYATEGMRQVWSPEGRIVLEREFWIAVMKAQRELGLDIPESAIADYERVKNSVDLGSIDSRERRTRHDVKARIEEFCELAGHEHIHKGMTSRDLTENVEQLQIMRSLQIVLNRGVAILTALADKAGEYADLTITSRTHNVAAQPSTFGKRLAMYGEEFEHACGNLERLVQTYPVRGLKGAVGTQLDQLTLFDNDASTVQALEEKVIEHLGFSSVLKSVGQVYPRSLDFEVVSALYQLGGAPSSFARTLRLMAGHELAGEGFAKGQVGSSAMPHKMNSRSCERINGFLAILRGHMTMAEGLAGDQWNEGDVSCSVVRRVLFPDAFLAIDGMLETTLVVLRQMQVFKPVIRRENDHYLPFLATTTILMEAVKSGAGREAAHEAIKEHAVSTVLDLREGNIDRNNLADRLAGDDRVGLTREQIDTVLARAETLTGAASAQIDGFRESVKPWQERYPDGAAYEPGGIL